MAFRPNRRTVLAGGVALATAGRAAAAEVRANGAVGLIATHAGLAGLVFAGEDGALLRPDGRWHIGSNSKALTAALYARLVDHGRCHWGATLPQLFPDLEVEASWRDVRVEELMSHAAGLTDAAIDGVWLQARHRDPTPAPVQRRQLAEILLAAPPGGPRGTYRYGNANYVLLGAAIEAATGRSWEQNLHDHLLLPLGMRETGFGAPPREGVWGRDDGSGAPRPVDPAGIADNPPVLWPSGGIHLTPGDYARFLSIFLPHGTPLLRPATLRHLLTPSSPDGGYAGGWSLAGSTGGEAQLLTHNGSNTFWFASARVDRAAGRGYAAIVNRGGAAGEQVCARLLRTLAHT